MHNISPLAPRCTHPCAPPNTLHGLLILSWRGCLASAHGALSCTPVAHTLAHRPLPLRALLILFLRGCQASYTRHLGSLRQLAIHARNLRYDRIFPCHPPHCARSRRSLKTNGDSRPTSVGTSAAAPWDFAGKWLAGEQRRAVQRFARLCSYSHGVHGDEHDMNIQHPNHPAITASSIARVLVP